jgi:alpha 1,3-glucosidase
MVYLLLGLAIYADGTREEKRTFEDVATPASTGESFGGHYDSMPNGPISVGMDISFPFAHHVYGIPEHTTPLSLPTSFTGSAGTPGHYSQPYRLYNLDVFEYELQETMALYGHIPLMWAHGKVADKKNTLTSVSSSHYSFEYGLF